MEADKVALITGGASGIGRAAVMQFLSKGWNVVTMDMNEEAGTRLSDEFADSIAANRLHFMVGDVAEERDIVAAVGYAESTFGRFDCVVNNAGIGGAFGPITEIEVDDWDYTFRVLSRGVFLGIKHGSRAMIRNGNGGSIVNVSSIAGLIGDAGPQAYSIAKAGVIHMARVLSSELAVHRIRINTVCPGIIATPMNSAAEDISESDLSRAQPWERLGRPEECASVIAFLASEASEFVTGECIAVDGGVVAAGPRIGTEFGWNSRSIGLTGVSHGTTGVEPTVRHRDVR